jgi:hypothetical protein
LHWLFALACGLSCQIGNPIKPGVFRQIVKKFGVSSTFDGEPKAPKIGTRVEY